MASEEHLSLSQFIKEVHLTLRKSTLNLGAEAAWQNHCNDNDTLAKYAQCMEKLATTHWEDNCNSDTSEAKSRITWVTDYCCNYFTLKDYTKYREKELTIADKLDLQINVEESYPAPLNLLDVGSCYNPFKVYNIFNVFAIDLHPANDSVYKCDFLNVNTGLSNKVNNSIVTELKANCFDVITFCFLLEYIPTSELRIKACEKAYSLLKLGGILIITTPDSKHVGANSKLIKCWRYTLSRLGFNRIKYEKLRFMHCMVFRKSLHIDVARRWATLYREPYMEHVMHIPQDFNKMTEETTCNVDLTKVSKVADDFQELPMS